MSDTTLNQAIPHTGRGRRVLILLAAAIAVALVVAAVAWGFRGRQIKRDADALMAPVPGTTTGTRPATR